MSRLLFVQRRTDAQHGQSIGVIRYVASSCGMCVILTETQYQEVLNEQMHAEKQALSYKHGLKNQRSFVL